NFNTDNPFSAFGQNLSASSVSAQGALNSLGVPRLGATIRAMERAGILRTLAEPNITAISGETATFVAGGEVPIQAGIACSQSTPGAQTLCSPTIQYKKFGVGLNFTPVVLSEGRISLKVATEVSEISAENSVTLPGTPPVVVPGIKARRAETTVEL